MFRSANDLTSGAAQRARDEIGEAWQHLLAAAEHGARQAGDTTRRQSAIARDRAAAAAQALRGEQPPSPWGWLAAGLAAGLAIGAVGAVVLGRRVQDLDAAAARQRASEAMETVRERTSEAAHNAMTTARDRAGKVTGKFGGSADSSSPAGTSEQGDRAAT